MTVQFFNDIIKMIVIIWGRKNMKKIFIVLIGCVLCFSLVACGSNTDQPQNGADSAVIANKEEDGGSKKTTIDDFFAKTPSTVDIELGDWDAESNALVGDTTIVDLPSDGSIYDGQFNDKDVASSVDFHVVNKENQGEASKFKDVVFKDLSLSYAYEDDKIFRIDVSFIPQDWETCLKLVSNKSNNILDLSDKAVAYEKDGFIYIYTKSNNSKYSISINISCQTRDGKVLNEITDVKAFGQSVAEKIK